MISALLSIVRDLALVAILACLACVPAGAATFNVNSPADTKHDANPGDGICETVAGNGACTLRAAIEETNALASADTINLQPGVTYPMSMTMSVTPTYAALKIADNLTINGSNNTIDAMGVGGVLLVTRCVREVLASDVCTYGSPVASVSGVAFVNGKAALSGGGIYNLATLSLSHCAVSSNTAGGIGNGYTVGGGIFNGGTLTLDDCVVAHNNATGYMLAYGGGIYNSGPMTVSNSVVSDNSTNGSYTYGGGIYNDNSGKLTIESSAVRDNIDSGTFDSEGGGLSSAGETIIRNSTFSGNHSNRGGGISGAKVALIDSTVSGNFSIADGGGLYVTQNVALYNATITDNTANFVDPPGTGIGGGIFVQDTYSVTLTNSIVQGNSRSAKSGQFVILVGDECAGSLTSIGDNLLSTDVVTAHCAVAGGYGTGSANFGPLAYNGGLTQTHALQTGSAAIDAGNLGGCTDSDDAVLTRDQRGVKRPYGARCDLGGFEAAEIIFRNGFDGG